MPRYDCFMFFNELEILEIRLNELAKFIDAFVIAEAPWTFQGKPKPLFFDDNRKRFRPFLSRIRHIVVDDELVTDDPWTRERHQRNSLRRGLQDVAPDSTVIVSDVDEIVRPAAIMQAESTASFCFLRMSLYLYFLDWKSRPWMKAYCAPWSFVSAMEDLSAPRMTEDFFLKQQGLEAEHHIVEDGGWHFSWLGGVPRMMQKLEAFSHTEPEVQRWYNENDLAREIAARRFFLRSRTPIDRFAFYST
jgi:beta-1,4-mannosyl-glycoprotein beta-1,4-N-acetylglucosaminyltransferase